MRRNCISKVLRFLQITAEHQDCSFFYRISNHKNFIPKYLDNAVIDFAQTSRTLRRLLEEKARVNDFGRTVLSGEKCGCKSNRWWCYFVAMTTPMSLQS